MVVTVTPRTTRCAMPSTESETTSMTRVPTVMAAPTAKPRPISFDWYEPSWSVIVRAPLADHLEVLATQVPVGGFPPRELHGVVPGAARDLVDLAVDIHLQRVVACASPRLVTPKGKQQVVVPVARTQNVSTSIVSTSIVDHEARTRPVDQSSSPPPPAKLSELVSVPVSST